MAIIENRVRDLVLRAKDAGWEGPPFSPLVIADLLGVPVEPNADVTDARTVPADGGVKIQFNPTQARARMRFSLAHEIAHTLFDDVADKIRNRGREHDAPDDWQLEMLCNIAAAEIIMPIGSLSSRKTLPRIEELMLERRDYDVSTEAYLIRVAKITEEPALMFCASPFQDTKNKGAMKYRVDYVVPSKFAPRLPISGKIIPSSSAVYTCTAIGYTGRGEEGWASDENLWVECVGIPSNPGNIYPRVAGIIRLTDEYVATDKIEYIHRDVLDPQGSGMRVVCQLVNNRAIRWGGGVPLGAAKKYPDAHKAFSAWVASIPQRERLGKVHFVDAINDLYLASLIAQEGYGPSPKPRIRYAALEKCFEGVAAFALENAATVHMPRIGEGQSGGSWNIVEEMVREIILDAGISVTVYDLPPKPKPAQEGLFD